MIVIDPGSAGGIVTVGKAFTAIAMPKTDGEVLAALVAGQHTDMGPVTTCYLEDLVKYAGRNMPSSSMAVYASNWGFIKGVAMSLGYKLVLVPPKKWQKALGLGSAAGMKRSEWKNKLKQRAEQLFPQIKVTLFTADALLMYEAANKGLI